MNALFLIKELFERLQAAIDEHLGRAGLNQTNNETNPDEQRQKAFEHFKQRLSDDQTKLAQRQIRLQRERARADNLAQQRKQTLKPMVVKSVDIQPITKHDLPLLTELTNDRNAIRQCLTDTPLIDDLVNADTLIELHPKTQQFVFDHVSNQKLEQLITDLEAQQLKTKQPKVFDAITNSLDLLARTVAKQGMDVATFKRVMTPMSQEISPNIKFER